MGVPVWTGSTNLATATAFLKSRRGSGNFLFVCKAESRTKKNIALMVIQAVSKFFGALTKTGMITEKIV